MTAIPQVLAVFSTSLAEKMSDSASSFTLSSATDKAGNALSGLYGFTIDEGTASEEFMIGTVSGSTVTVSSRGLDPENPNSEVAALKVEHRRGATVKITNYPVLAFLMRILNGDDTIPNLIQYASELTPTDNKHLATKKYVDDIAAGGTATIDRIVVAGDAGETVAAGQVVYFDDTDNEWKLADGSSAATAEGVILGIAQGAGTDGGAINGGVLLQGLDSNQSGLTAGVKLYLSDTAGTVAESAGTVEVTLGFSKSTTEIYFVPRYDQQITEDIQDALEGANGTASSSNVYISQTGLQRNQEVYAADAEANDTYVITLSPAPAAYVAGMVVHFKANTANTGAATLNVNSLGAVTIKKHHDQDLEDNDIESGQVVTVVHDGTNFQMVSQLARAPIYSETPDSIFVPATTSAGAYDGVINGMGYVSFPDSSSTNAYASVFIPSGATISKVEGVFLSGNTTDNFIINYTVADLPSAAVHNTDSDADNDSDNTVADTQPSDEGIFHTIPSDAYNGLTQGRIWTFQLQRNGGHASDTAASTVKCVGILVTYA